MGARALTFVEGGFKSSQPQNLIRNQLSNGCRFRILNIMDDVTQTIESGQNERRHEFCCLVRTQLPMFERRVQILKLSNAELRPASVTVEIVVLRCSNVCDRCVHQTRFVRLCEPRIFFHPREERLDVVVGPRLRNPFLHPHVGAQKLNFLMLTCRQILVTVASQKAACQIGVFRLCL